MKLAARGKWRWYDSDPSWLIAETEFITQILNVEGSKATDGDRAYIAALPDIAQLALDLAKENEELKAK